jgi:hypothetical protein
MPLGGLLGRLVVDEEKSTHMRITSQARNVSQSPLRKGLCLFDRGFTILEVTYWPSLHVNRSAP